MGGRPIKPKSVRGRARSRQSKRVDQQAVETYRKLETRFGKGKFNARDIADASPFFNAQNQGHIQRIKEIIAREAGITLPSHSSIRVKKMPEKPQAVMPELTPGRQAIIKKAIKSALDGAGTGRTVRKVAAGLRGNAQFRKLEFTGIEALVRAYLNGSKEYSTHQGKIVRG